MFARKTRTHAGIICPIWKILRLTGRNLTWTWMQSSARHVHYLSPSTFKNFEKGSMAENTTLIDTEEDKENSPHPRTTPISEISTRSLFWWEIAHLEQYLRRFPIMFIEICFTNFYYFHYGVSILIKNMNAMFHFIIFSFQKTVIHVWKKRAVPVLLSVTLLLAPSFCKKTYSYREKSGTPKRNQKSKSPSNWVQGIKFDRRMPLSSWRNFSVGCNCLCWHAGKRCERNMWWS